MAKTSTRKNPPSAKKCRFEKYRRTLRGLAHARYRAMCHRIRKRGWPEPDFTKEEFISWTLMDARFIQIFTAWEKSGHKKDWTPSLDRIDAGRSYVRGNLRWMTWKDNWRKGVYHDHLGGELFNHEPMDSIELPY